MNRKFALTATLAAGIAAAGMALAPMAADAALLELTRGTEFDTPSGNNVVGAGKKLLDNAGLSTTEDNVELTFHFLGSESGFNNTLNVGGPGGETPSNIQKHTEADKYPASWSGSPIIDPVTQASAGSVNMFFESSGFSEQLKPGLGDTSKSIAFAYLASTSDANISATPTDVVLFALDDGGSRARKRGSSTDGDFDDFVGYVKATRGTPASISEAAPVTPAPIPAALPLFVTAMVGLGLMGRRKKAAA